MWDKMKKKLKQLFREDTSEESQPNKTTSYQNKYHTEKSELHAKISYQYPSEGPFKFPVIPDQKKNQQSSEKPAFERKQRRQENAVNKHESKRVIEEDEKKKEPFKVSDVPSPVYGYQRRNKQKKELEDIPAYIRKEVLSTNPRTTEHEEQAKKEEQSQEENKEIDKDNSAFHEPLGNQQDKSVELENSEEDSLVEKEAFEKIDNTQPEQREGAANSKVITFEASRDKKEVEKKRGTRAEHRRERLNKTADDSHQTDEQSGYDKKKSVPFNVIMTPRDKKSRFDERKERNQEKENWAEMRSRPPLYLLNDPIKKTNEDNEWVEQQIELLETTLKHFYVKANVVNAMRGPSVTRFEVQPELGVKVSKVKNLSDDIKLNMSAKDIRMEAPIPGKNRIGIEVPNPESQPVGLQEIFESDAFKDEASPLTVALGLDIAGNPVVTNLQKMPHGLIAGATGSGKSVCINTILVSLLYKASHEEVKFLLIDPKMVELAPYNELPHLVSPVITDVKAATSALKWAVNEMEERYEKFVQESTRDVERYNEKMEKQGRKAEKMPYLVIVIDELADLMMVSPQDVEDAICRIAQKARACGIHLLLATQRPSVDVITGLIKANIPTRIAFSVSSQVDSRTIIDTNGAEKLLGKGDMLFVENGKGQSVRIQGSFVSDDEIERVASFVKKTAPPQYLFEQEQLLEQIHTEAEEDSLYGEAVELVVNQNGASTSLLQRRFKIGYNRAARLIDHMEANGIISEQNGSKPRDVLISGAQTSEYL